MYFWQLSVWGGVLASRCAPLCRIIEVGTDLQDPQPNPPCPLTTSPRAHLCTALLQVWGFHFLHGQLCQCVCASGDGELENHLLKRHLPNVLSQWTNNSAQMCSWPSRVATAWRVSFIWIHRLFRGLWATVVSGNCSQLAQGPCWWSQSPGRWSCRKTSSDKLSEGENCV